MKRENNELEISNKFRLISDKLKEGLTFKNILKL